MENCKFSWKRCSCGHGLQKRRTILRCGGAQRDGEDWSRDGRKLHIRTATTDRATWGGRGEGRDRCRKDGEADTIRYDMLEATSQGDETEGISVVYVCVSVQNRCDLIGGGSLCTMRYNNTRSRRNGKCHRAGGVQRYSKGQRADWAIERVFLNWR